MVDPKTAVDKSAPSAGNAGMKYAKARKVQRLFRYTSCLSA